jgi:hypothetical protein
MDDGRDELDRLIDGALASYSDAEPRLGLEARVVNRVRAPASDVGAGAGVGSCGFGCGGGCDSDGGADCSDVCGRGADCP